MRKPHKNVLRELTRGGGGLSGVCDMRTNNRQLLAACGLDCARRIRDSVTNGHVSFSPRCMRQRPLVSLQTRSLLHNCPSSKTPPPMGVQHLCWANLGNQRMVPFVGQTLALETEQCGRLRTSLQGEVQQVGEKVVVCMALWDMNAHLDDAGTLATGQPPVPMLVESNHATTLQYSKGDPVEARRSN